MSQGGRWTTCRKGTTVLISQLTPVGRVKLPGGVPRDLATRDLVTLDDMAKY